MDRLDWEEESLDEPGLGTPDPVPYQELFEKLRLPLGLLMGGMLLASVIFYGLGNLFAKPPTFEVSGAGVERLRIGDAVYLGDTTIGKVQSIESQRSRTVAHLSIDRPYLKIVAESPQFEVESQSSLFGGQATKVVLAGSSGKPLDRERLLEAVGQFKPSRSPSLSFYLMGLVLIIALFWIGMMVMRLAQAAAKFVGFAIVVGVIVVAALVVLGQLKVLGS